MTGEPAQPLPLTTDHFAAQLARGPIRVGPATVWFNRTYSPPGGSYSVRLRPDISVLAPDSSLHLLDAKLRRTVTLVSAGSQDPDSDDETDTFRRGDVYKMHAYRDAIHEARSVWVLYPGGGFERVFYHDPDISGFDGVSGVGALPLRPGNAASRELLDDLCRSIAAG